MPTQCNDVSFLHRISRNCRHVYTDIEAGFTFDVVRLSDCWLLREINVSLTLLAEKLQLYPAGTKASRMYFSTTY